VAIGGLAIGYYAIGGAAFGPHAIGPLGRHAALPEWLSRFLPWGRP
jgi:hypothetical protein